MYTIFDYFLISYQFMWFFAGVPLSARNILEDPELKGAVKAFRYMISSMFYSEW